MVAGRSATGTSKMNVTSADLTESEEGRYRKCRGSKKNHLVRKEVTEHTHKPSRSEPTDGRKALIAPESLRQRRMSNQSKADRGNRRSEKSTGRTLTTSAVNTRGKLGQSVRIPALMRIMATPSATTNRFDRTLSKSSPPGTWLSIPATPLAVK